MTGSVAEDTVQPEAARARARASQGMAARFVILCDRDGRRHAIARHAVTALCEEDGTTALLLPGGRMILIDLSLEDVVDLLSLPPLP